MVDRRVPVSANEVAAARLLIAVSDDLDRPVRQTTRKIAEATPVQPSDGDAVVRDWAADHGYVVTRSTRRRRSAVPYEPDEDLAAKPLDSGFVWSTTQDDGLVPDDQPEDALALRASGVAEPSLGEPPHQL